MVLKALEANAALLQQFHEVDEPLRRAAQAVELPDHKHIIAAEVAERVLHAGPVGLRAGDRVFEEECAPGFLQGVSLDVEVLVGCRDARVANAY